MEKGFFNRALEYEVDAEVVSTENSVEALYRTYDVDVIGIGEKGLNALHRYETIEHNFPYVGSLHLYSDVRLLPKKKQAKPKTMPMLFWLVDLREDSVQAEIVTATKSYREINPGQMFAVCVVLCEQLPLITLELIDSIDLIILVDGSEEAMLSVPELIFNDMYRGLIGMDMTDTVEILKSCQRMCFFRKSGTSVTEYQAILDGLKDKMKSLTGANTAVVCAKMNKRDCDVSFADQVFDTFGNMRAVLVQMAWNDDENDKSVTVATLCGL